ncbi:MAG: PCRF domain-containing protein, partial [Verrucomicrobiota bacterium]|nr:PCRF domain-containing protein [Verrucomicrobiota bacterium]
MDFQELIQRKRDRFVELEREIADPALFENRKRAGEVMREHSAVKQMLALWNDLDTARRQLEDNRELVASGDAELAQ